MNETRDPDNLKEHLASMAVGVALEGFGVELDYSVGSVRRVEELLGAIHKECLGSQDRMGVNGLALEFAAYIIRVVERNYDGGTWSRDHHIYGAKTFPFEWRGIDVFPYSWCLKRILDGPGENVWAKFQTSILSKT